MQTNLPPLTRQSIDAFAASALRWLGWLLRVIIALGTSWRSEGLHLALARMEREVESILLCEAMLHHGPPPLRRRHPRPAPRGFGRTRNHRHALFFKRAGVRARGRNALARVLRLFDVLARPQAFIAYFLKRLIKGLRGAALIVAAPTAWALCDGVRPREAFADSS